jgi:response regulator RpfG family c-di-GMP phosphodiesterase
VNRVLVIDDHEPNLKLYAHVITQIADTEAFTFLSANAGLAWAGMNETSLLLVDQEMGELSGLEFIRLFRALRGRAETPIIMLTGNADRDLRRAALRSGASAFLTKPVDPVEFLAIATNFIATYRVRGDAVARAEANFAHVKALTAELHLRDREEIELLFGVAELRDKRAAEHMARTALIAERIGRRVGLSQIELDAMAIAARVHDIGKLAVPDRVLYKTGRLTPEDRVALNKHTVDGHAMLKNGRSALMKLAAEIALSHHERFDGKGYPGGLRGDAVPQAARIVGLADAFSAMTARRPWREPMTVGHAVEEIERMSGSAFAPTLVGALREAMTDVLEVRAQIPDLQPPIAR